MGAPQYAYEVAYAPASPAYVQDQTIIRPAFELLRAYDGVHEMYSGIELEDPSILVVIAWDTYDAHQAYMKKGEYQSYIDYLTPELGGGATPLHVYFTGDPIPSFNSAVTEVLWITPRSEAQQTEVVATLDKIVEFAGKNVAEGIVSATYGSVLENPGQFVAVIGWSSLKPHVKKRRPESLKSLIKDLLSLIKDTLGLAHHTFVGSPEPATVLNQIVADLKRKVDLKVVHSALTPFVK